MRSEIYLWKDLQQLSEIQNSWDTNFDDRIMSSVGSKVKCLHLPKRSVLISLNKTELHQTEYYYGSFLGQNLKEKCRIKFFSEIFLVRLDNICNFDWVILVDFGCFCVGYCEYNVQWDCFTI